MSREMPLASERLDELEAWAREITEPGAFDSPDVLELIAEIRRLQREVARLRNALET